MKQLTLLSFFILGILFAANAQKKTPIKWGKIPPEDLAMTVYEADPEANAVVLADVGKATFDVLNQDLQLVYNRHKRVKILKRSGFDNGNISFTYYSDEGLEKLNNIRAQIISKSGQVTKLSKDDFFHTNCDGYRTKVAFTFPEMEEGAIFEYEYEIFSKINSRINTWFFADEIPTRLSRFYFAHPSDIVYIQDLRQGELIQKIGEFGHQSSITFADKGFMERFFTDDLGNRTSHTVDINILLEIYEAKKLPAMKEVDFLPTMKDYAPRISFQAAVEKFGTPRNIFSSWKDVASWFLSKEALGARLNAALPAQIKKDIDALCASKTSDKEKIAVIHHYLTSNFKWNSYISPYAVREFGKMDKEKSGNSCDLSMLLIAMLKSQGIKAHPAITSTRRHGKVNTQIPMVDQFNHVLVYTELDEKAVLMDAVAQRPFFLPSEMSLNYTAFVLIDHNTFDFVNVTAPKSFTTISVDAKVVDGEIAGKINFDYKNESACKKREQLKNASSSEQANFIKNLFHDEAESIFLDGLQFEGLDVVSPNVKGSADFILPIDEGELIYLTPFLGAGNSGNPFVQETRDLPVDFANKLGQTLVFNFEIPEGYEVETMPQVSKVTLLEKDGQFQYIPSLNGNTLQIMSRVNLNRTFFEHTEYEFLKAFFEEIVKIHAEPIVLKKS